MNQLTVDRTTLAAALLDAAKAQCRVTHGRDDVLIQQYVAQAIEAVERRCSINLNPALFELDLFTLEALPCVGWPGRCRLALPVNNVHAFTLKDADGIDQADLYTIEQGDLGGSAAAYLVGPAVVAADWAMTVDVGVDTTELLSPAVAAVVLRLTGGYYENRESPSALVVDDFLGELASIWRPSA
jgi:hypothetical protein